MWTVFVGLEVFREGRENEHVIHPTTEKHCTHLPSIFCFNSYPCRFSSCRVTNLSLALISWLWGINAFKTLKQLKEMPLVCQVHFTFTHVLLLDTFRHMLLSAHTHSTTGWGMLHGAVTSSGSGAGEIPPAKSRGLSQEVCAPAWMTLLPLACLQLPSVGKMSSYAGDTQTHTGHRHGQTHRLRQARCCLQQHLRTGLGQNPSAARSPPPRGLVKAEGH